MSPRLFSGSSSHTHTWQLARPRILIILPLLPSWYHDSPNFSSCVVIAYPFASHDHISLLHSPSMVINDPRYAYVSTCFKMLLSHLILHVATAVVITFVLSTLICSLYFYMHYLVCPLVFAVPSLNHGCKSRGAGGGYSPSKNLPEGAKYCTSPPKKRMK